MNKIIFVLLIVALLTPPCWAAKYYLFIQKSDDGDDIPYAQKNYAGDVISFSPYSARYKPTQSEYDRYQIIVVDLTQDDLLSLIQEKKNPELVTEILEIKKEFESSAVNNLTRDFPDFVVTAREDLGDRVRLTSRYTKEVRTALRSQSIDLQKLKITKQEQTVTKNALFTAVSTKSFTALDNQ